MPNFTPVRPKVYVTQESPTINYLPAESYGDVTFITRDDVSNIKSSLNNDMLVRRIRMALKPFDQDVDWIILSGSPYVTALVFVTLGQMGITNLRMLRWANRDRLYIPVEISVKRHTDEERV